MGTENMNSRLNGKHPLHQIVDRHPVTNHSHANFLFGGSLSVLLPLNVSPQRRVIV